MRRVILESPFRGKTENEEAVNRAFAKACMLDSLRRGESPLASHLLWPGILDDADPLERRMGIEAGLAWGTAAEATVVYENLGISSGMEFGIARAAREGRPIERRSLDNWPTRERAPVGAPSAEPAPVGPAAVQAAQ